MIRLIGFLFTLSILFSLRVSGQGIQFETISFEEVLEKAQKEDKLVFIDFYTTWCAPCKSLDKFVFTDEKVGNLYNYEFVNIKLDAEREGVDVAKKYGVQSYPTLVFVNGLGEMVYKKSGGLDIVKMLELGNKVLEEVQSGYSIVSLKQQYASKKQDERFLSMYINKMVASGERPYDAVEEWLNIQTQIKEDDVDMMEFLLKHASLLLIGSKAEQILKENYDEYWSIATKKEEGALKRMQTKIVNNTRELAYEKKDPQLFRLFINKWKDLYEGDNRRDVFINYELEYLLLAKDYTAFKNMAEKYIDSLTSAKSLEQIYSEDQAFYEDYKETEYMPSLVDNSVLEQLKQGRQARAQMGAIHKVGAYYLRHCETKKEYKKLLSWLDYGVMLVPDDYKIEDLRASVYQKKGDLKKAIISKEAALNKLPENHRRRLSLQKELDLMKESL